jgi:hypothetical protein
VRFVFVSVSEVHTNIVLNGHDIVYLTEVIEERERERYIECNLRAEC